MTQLSAGVYQAAGDGACKGRVKRKMSVDLIRLGEHARKRSRLFSFVVALRTSNCRKVTRGLRRCVCAATSADDRSHHRLATTQE